MGAVVGVVLGILVVAWIIHPLLEGPRAPLEGDDRELAELRHRRDMALLALREVEEDHGAGRLDETDYRILKDEVAVEALGAMEAEETARAARGGGFCPECGTPAPAAARYCGHCGVGLPGAFPRRPSGPA